MSGPLSGRSPSPGRILAAIRAARLARQVKYRPAEATHERARIGFPGRAAHRQGDSRGFVPAPYPRRRCMDVTTGALVAMALAGLGVGGVGVALLQARRR